MSGTNDYGFSDQNIRRPITSGSQRVINPHTKLVPLPKNTYYNHRHDSQYMNNQPRRNLSRYDYPKISNTSNMIRSSELPYAGTIVSSPTNSTFEISEPVPIEPLNLIGTVDSRHTNREPKSSTTIPQITRPTPGTRKVTSVRPQTGFRQTKLSTFLKTKSKFTCQFICVTSLILVPICIFIVIMIMSGDATV